MNVGTLKESPRFERLLISYTDPKSRCLHQPWCIRIMSESWVRRQTTPDSNVSAQEVFSNMEPPLNASPIIISTSFCLESTVMYVAYFLNMYLVPSSDDVIITWFSNSLIWPALGPCCWWTIETKIFKETNIVHIYFCCCYHSIRNNCV